MQSPAQWPQGERRCTAGAVLDGCGYEQWQVRVAKARWARAPGRGEQGQGAGEPRG